MTQTGKKYGNTGFIDDEPDPPGVRGINCRGPSRYAIKIIKPKE